jgi:hypothetical protein
MPISNGSAGPSSCTSGRDGDPGGRLLTGRDRPRPESVRGGQETVAGKTFATRRVGKIHHVVPHTRKAVPLLEEPLLSVLCTSRKLRFHSH